MDITQVEGNAVYTPDGASKPGFLLPQPVPSASDCPMPIFNEDPQDPRVQEIDGVTHFEGSPVQLVALIVEDVLTSFGKRGWRNLRGTTHEAPWLAVGRRLQAR